ncbi:MAG: S41 family peptidase [Vicinamibacterales bacterium]
MRLALRLRLVAPLLVASVWAPRAADAQSTACTTVRQNLTVRDVMQDLYYWNRLLPNPNPAAFASPEAYLEAVRYRPLDTTFSYISQRAADDAFFSDSQFIGIGLSTKLTDDQLFISQVFPDSPASEAGLLRGDRVLAINGRTIDDLVASGDIGNAFGPSTIDYEVQLTFAHPDGQEVSATAIKRLVTIPTVSQTVVLDLDGVRIGYLHFRNFVQPSFGALDEAFATLKAAGVRELVLDLRYNGGGLVSVAQHLASLVGGVYTTGQVFATFAHNSRNSFRDTTLRFGGPENALGLDRLVVITTRASASASELVINALRPFMPVVIVGDRTFGKPVGQYSVNFCDKVVHPVAFALKNANGEGGYFDGLAADCPAADDLTHPLGTAGEASLSEALQFLRTGACTPQPAAESTRIRAARDRSLGLVTGWQQLVNAY